MIGKAKLKELGLETIEDYFEHIKKEAVVGQHSMFSSTSQEVRDLIDDLNRPQRVHCAKYCIEQGRKFRMEAYFTVAHTALDYLT